MSCYGQVILLFGLEVTSVRVTENFTLKYIEVYCSLNSSTHGIEISQYLLLKSSVQTINWSNPWITILCKRSPPSTLLLLPQGSLFLFFHSLLSSPLLYAHHVTHSSTDPFIQFFSTNSLEFPPAHVSLSAVDLHFFLRLFNNNNSG